MKLRNTYNLAIVNPTLAAEWHPTKNGNLTPMDVTPKSSYRAWWRCKKGHEWQATVSNRSNGRGCKKCLGRIATPEYNLAVVNPTLAAEWHPTKNGKLTPKDVTPGSKRKVWWLCNKGHEWQVGINGRAKGGKCSFCVRNKVSKDNCLKTLRPDLAKEWHPTKNDRTPWEVIPGSGYKAWWRCKKGHEWQATIAKRNLGRKKCRRCNSLAMLRPDLAKEWHPTKNDKTPWEVIPGSGYKAWWKCNWDHEWQTKVCHRSDGRGCRECWKRLQKGLLKGKGISRL